MPASAKLTLVSPDDLPKSTAALGNHAAEADRDGGAIIRPGSPVVTTISLAAGGYRYIPGVFQYSAGVRALPGFEIVRVQFREPLLI